MKVTLVLHLLTLLNSNLYTMSNLNNFTNLYPLQKTLRLGLIPIAETLEHIKAHGLLEQDQHRAESYVEVKRIIDRYHKALIERILDELCLNVDKTGNRNELLDDYLFYYLCKSKDEATQKKFDETKKKLRKIIADSFKKDDKFKRIDKKELIKEDLVEFLTDDKEKALVAEFNNFTTYFTGFHENRLNMYTDEEHTTAIAYRLIHENLPKFIDNIMVFDKIAISPIAEHLPELYSNFEQYLNVMSIDEMFKIDYYNIVLTQTQIDVYNSLIGGQALEDGTKIKGLNEYINLYNQQQKDKSLRLPKFKPLFKQILSDRNAISFLPEQFTSDNDVLDAIQQCYNALNELVLNRNRHGEHSLKQMLLCLSDYDLNKIYIRNDQQLTDISQRLFGAYDTIEKSLLCELKTVVALKKKESEEAYEERLRKILSSQGSISIAHINNCVAKSHGIQITVQDYFATLGSIEKEHLHRDTLFNRIQSAYADAQELLNTRYPSDKNLAQDQGNVDKIKTLLDTFKELQRFAKPLLGDGTEADKDDKFYGEFVALWEELNQITPLYNKVRNYMTRKPYSTEKIKLNFENSTLMDGWDVNKESANTTIILRKDGLYYLAIMNPKHNRVFEAKNTPADGECYEKMEYKLLPGPNKMLPKVFFSKSNIDAFAPSEQLLENYKNDTHKKGENFNIKDCHALIDFFKDSISKHKDWKNFGFVFSDTATYQDLSGFYREVEHQGYKLSFRNISATYIDQLVKDGKIYLFQIYNKDFSPHSKGTPNLHTLYWKMLFDEQNLKDVVYKLNGKAEIFFRKSSLTYARPTHPANVPISNKNKLNRKAQSVFEYDLVKDKRYTVDKFQFHVPITINFKSSGTENINRLTNQFIQESDDLHIIGIDRGERHLLYLTVIDLQGNIKEQYSLNEIVNNYNGNEYRTNYHTLLSERQDQRQRERQSWKTIENIKDLKEGYLSQVVHKICKLIIKYNAIVVLEDLNMGFKQSRQKVESSVYQQFEKMLIDKLNFLADKKTSPKEIGGILNAYQLTGKFEGFKKMGKQNGFLFYIPAWNTSKMDPVTGFVNLFDTRYETREKAKSFFSKFDSIIYNTQKDWFEFAFNYDNFTHKAEGARTRWILCTQGMRIETFRDPSQNSQWTSVEVNLTEQFKTLFEMYGIDINSNLKDMVIEQNSADFFKKLMHLLKLTLQLRNSKTGTDIDYMVSPVADKDGTFFNSETCGDNLPKNADANGAYNIARKGLYFVRKIKEQMDLSKLKLSITNKEWLKFVQDQEYLD